MMFLKKKCIRWNILLIVSVYLFPAFTNVAKLNAQHIVKSTGDLTTLLSEDKEQGVILLDGDLFHIAGLEVKAGGVIKPFPGRKPVLIGFHQKVEKGNRKIDKNGYWNAKIKGYGSTQIVFLDEHLEPIPYSCHLNGHDGFDIKAEKIQIVNKKERLIKIPIPSDFVYLKKRDKQFLRNFSVKVGYWFVGMELRQLYSDENYLYGAVDNDYNFNLLSIRPYANVRVDFFNLPKFEDGVFLDGNDVLNVPAQYKTVYVCTTPPILKLNGDRDLTFEAITFTGANNTAIEISGSNKHFKNCIVRNCGKGIVTVGGIYSDCSVRKCLFENMFNNSVVSLAETDNDVIEDNIFRHTGTLYKGGAVAMVGGLNFKVTNNNVSDFSYIGICVSKSKDYKPGTVTGIVKGNVVDNKANYGKAENQLDDGGGIYVIAHTDGVVITDNIVRNIGYDKGWMHGIYLDDGAYNVTVKNNLVYNICASSKAVYSRYVEETERSCMNNVFEDNILVGNCVMAGNQNGAGGPTIIKGNFIAGEIESSTDTAVVMDNNRKIVVDLKNNGVVKLKNKNGLKKRRYSKSIRKLLK